MIDTDNLNPIDNIKNLLLRSIDLLRHQHIGPEDYHLILYMLLLQRHGFITELISKHSSGRELYSLDFT